ncbi:MAG: hypothetical protein HRT67_12190 [Flavobacteriaceae bacterium]|nr:hypothetical protein [Flavobacteriaceae bacterium]
MKINILGLLLITVLSSCKERVTMPLVEEENAIKTEESNWELAFTISDLLQPESVAYDATRNVLFVSNQNQDKEGFISMITLDGAVIEKEWVKGLVNPKGIEIVGDNLFVSDETVLVKIDINKAEITKKYKGKHAVFLNDVASDTNGNIYVSDMFTSAIYKLNLKGEFENWLQTPELDFPNGLLIKDDYIYIGAWGKITDGKALEAKKGHVLKVSISDKSITTISAEAFGNLDGIQNFQDGFLFSDWMNGNIYTFLDGKHKTIIQTKRGSGDIAYLKEQERIYIPMALEDKVLVYQKSITKHPLGMKRDSSYYTRIEWTNATLTTPLYWVNNIIDNDVSRNGGSWGAPTNGPAEVILSFFGETQTIKRIKIFHNVGATISPLDELASKINIFVSNTPNLQRIGDENAELSNFEWSPIISADMEQKEGWVDFPLKTPIKARYVRLQLVENFGTPPERAFTETNEIKIY